MREAPNLERTVRGIHTIDGGSRPLPVWHVFRASASDYSWWSIIDRLLYKSTSESTKRLLILAPQSPAFNVLATLTLQSVLHWPGRKITLQGFEVKGHFGIPFQYSIPVFHSSIPFQYCIALPLLYAEKVEPTCTLRTVRASCL